LAGGLIWGGVAGRGNKGELEEELLEEDRTQRRSRRGGRRPGRLAALAVQGSSQVELQWRFCEITQGNEGELGRWLKWVRGCWGNSSVAEGRKGALYRGLYGRPKCLHREL